MELAVLNLDSDGGVYLLAQFAFGSLNGNNILRRYLHFHTLRKVDGHFTNS
jgi:hypothetical protein